MKIDIYKSANSGSKYLSVPSGTKMAELQLPADTDADLLTLSPLKTRLELDPKKKQAALDIADITKQIAAQGYAIHGVEITITVGGSAS